MKPDRETIETILGSGLFDAAWYEERYHDVAPLGIGAVEHYLRIGARLNRNPGPRFDTGFYLETHQDVASSGLNPLLHYLRHGIAEGRACVPPSAPAGATAPALPQATPAAKWREFRGCLARQEAAKTVLVCAHVAGKHLYGGERSLLDLLDGFARAGYNAVVAMPGVGNLDYLQAVRDRCVAAFAFPYGWWLDGEPADEGMVATFADLISTQAVDAVHANTIMLREPLLAARRMAVPAVVHVRELIARDVALCELIGEPPERIVAQVLEHADWVVANSETTARAFAKPGATLVVPNTVDTDALELPPPVSGEAVRIGMVSSNLPKKGILDFVAIANLLETRMPQARFVLVGPDNAHTQALREQQAAGALSRNIVFAGYRDEPVAAMAELDILLNLSHFQESFGRTVLEAMAARRPVVAYDWGALSELVVEGTTGHLVPFRDVAEVADRILALYANPARIAAMGEAARARAVEHFGHASFIARLDSAYGRILASRREAVKLVLPARKPSRGPEDRPLRIAYFLWHFPVPSETFVLNELRVLVARGHDVHVYCRQSPHAGFRPDFPIEWTAVRDDDELAGFLSETRREIVHSHFTYPTVTEMVWPACEKARVPFTFIAHAQDIFRYSNDDKNRIGEIGRSPWCLRVLVPSRFHRDYVESRGVPADKLLINPNGIDPSLYAGGIDADRPRRRRRSICALHRFTEKKGLEHLIRAGRLLAGHGISIHLYGYGESESAYRRIIEAEGIENVTIHGPVGSRDEMLEVFRGHDLFACPSVRAGDGDMDGIPTVLMEAMASGMPVLATAISGIPDLVRNEVTGIVCDASPEAIAQAVLRFYRMPDVQVSGIIEDAAGLIRRDFDGPTLAENLLRLWQGRTIDLMIVSWNNLPQLREVVSRLRRFTQLPFHLIVCDNGSGSDVAAFLCDLYAQSDNTTIVFNRENAYVGPGTNICLAHGGSDYAVYVCGKEGFVLDFGWERSLVQYMDAHPEVGMAGTQCYSPSYLAGAQYPVAIPLFGKFRNPEFAAANPERRFSHIQGGFFVLRRAMYEEIGGFSTDVPHSYTDVEYSYYVESMGWKLASAPRLLSLFNKTRPGLFSRVDDNVAATHPPLLEDLPLLDRLTRKTTVHCNLCGWHDDGFATGEFLCGSCGSRPADRSLYRFLAESMLTYRRLPALGVNLGPAIDAIWRQQFQGLVMTSMELERQLVRLGRLDARDGAMKFVHVAFGPDELPAPAMVAEIDRLLAPDGLLLLHAPAEALDRFVEACGLRDVQPLRFSSAAVRYDWMPLHVCRRVGVSQCVS